jgi:NADH-quinone oxidoreductase subunit K
MIVPLNHILIVSTLLFFMGLGCILMRRNLIMVLIGIEIMLNAAGLTLVGASARWQQPDGQVLVLLLMGVTAAEVAIALALVVYLYGRKRTLDINSFDGMKG